MPALFFCWLIAALAATMVGGTLLSLWDHPHWFVRGWDFPRVQILSICAVSGLLYGLFCFTRQWYDWALAASLLGASLWQLACVFPYLPLAPRTVQDSDSLERISRMRLVISNVERDNPQCELWKQVVMAADPDVILAVETDQRWEHALQPLAEFWPRVVHQPQDNCYGMMLFSRLDLADVEVQCRVQSDVPSITAKLRLPCGVWLRFYGVHPRPPEPQEDQNATPRDAELVLIGEEIGQQDEPTIVAGDLNDVAWSKTTRLFQRLSGLLDPRRGRGFYNTWNANYPLMRFPLDHVFHSKHFQLVQLQRLDYVGSDHFPVLIDLSYLPQQAEQQSPPEQRSGDREEAHERIEREIDAERKGQEEEEGILASKSREG